MTSLREVKARMVADPENWRVYLMDFVDDFRHYRDLRAVAEPFERNGSRFDALLASTAEYLCDEMDLAAPPWLAEVPACGEPFFVSGLENLKAVSIVESPLRF